MPPSAPPSLHVFIYSPYAHQHGALSRAHSIIEVPWTDALVPFVHSHHRSKRGLPGCPSRVLKLQQGGVWRCGDGAITGAGRHFQCSFTPGSLGWLEMKERWEGSSEVDLKWTDVVNWISDSHGKRRRRLTTLLQLLLWSLFDLLLRTEKWSIMMQLDSK